MQQSPLFALAIGLLALGACADTTSELDDSLVSIDEPLDARGGTAPFPTWRQSFQHDTDGWITDDVPGPDGWCGEISRLTRAEARSAGGSAPSTGSGYATVAGGMCNSFWQGNGFVESGPYSPGAGFHPLPPSGYVTELDVWLDPDWTAAQVFTYAFSVLRLDPGYPYGLLYSFVPATTSGGTLYVAGEEIAESGWYTFRHTVDTDGSELSIRFELLRQGLPIVGQRVTTVFDAFEAPIAVSDLDPSNMANGYVWFAWIQPGLQLPIDDHIVRPGR